MNLSPSVFKTVYAESNIAIVNIIFVPSMSVHDHYVLQFSHDTCIYIYVDENFSPIGMDIVNNGFYHNLANMEFDEDAINQWYALCCRKLSDLDNKLIKESDDILLESIDD